MLGSKEDAERIKRAIGDFLSNYLKLKMSNSKTKITHTSNRARFLGYDITVSRDKVVKKNSSGKTQRVNSYAVKLLVPREKWVGKLLEYKTMKIVITANGKERFKALHRGKLTNKTDIEILSAFNSEIRGLYNFYSLANDAWKIGKFANVMKYSMFKTFANKYRTTVHRIKEKYFKNDQFTVSYETKSGKKESVFYNGGFEHKLKPSSLEDVDVLPPYKKYDRPNTLRNRIKNGICELCGTETDNIELHQVRRLKDLTGAEPWEAIMLKRRRKTLAVCPNCHKMIHPDDYLSKQ